MSTEIIINTQFVGLLFFLYLNSLTANAQNQPLCPLGDGWTFVSEFSDEFDGESLDTAKWWDFNPTFYGRKPGVFSRENVAVKNGTLQLTARHQKPEEVSIENKVRGFDQFTTAIVKSQKRVKYGYFEARCKSMNASVCNAFWLYDPLDPVEKYIEGSFSEEIDIFEIFGKPNDKKSERLFYATVHRYCTPYFEAIVNRKKFPLENRSFKLKMPFDFHQDFHTYALLWTPTELKWYVDGKEVFSRDNDYFNKPLHITFDCEIMKDWVGLPDPADLPSTFYIDYVRIWQKE